MLVLMVSLMSHLPLVTGLAFLEKEPPAFECLDSTLEWSTCNKTKICANNLPDFEYRPVVDEAEYIYNWIEKFDMLCEPHTRVGMLGSCYFFGTFLTILALPILSDKLGRSMMFNITMVVSSVTQLGLMLTTSLDIALWQMVVIGMTFGGKNIVGLNYFLEFLPLKQQQSTVLAYMYMEPALTIYLAFHYQFLDRCWFSLQLIFLIL